MGSVRGGEYGTPRPATRACSSASHGAPLPGQRPSVPSISPPAVVAGGSLRIPARRRCSACQKTSPLPPFLAAARRRCWTPSPYPSLPFNAPILVSPAPFSLLRGIGCEWRVVHPTVVGVWPSPWTVVPARQRSTRSQRRRRHPSQPATPPRGASPHPCRWCHWRERARIVAAPLTGGRVRATPMGMWGRGETAAAVVPHLGARQM